MATTTSSPATAATIEGDPWVTMLGLKWKGYLTIRRLRGDRPAPRMIYLDGDLQLVSPSYIHERFAERLGIFVIAVVVGLEIPCMPSGSTRQAKGCYARVESSLVFPFLKATEVFAWITKPETATVTEWTMDLRRRVRDTFVPRRAGMQS